MCRPLLVGMLCAGLLSACGTPPYRPAATAQSARVHFVKFDMPYLCLSGERFVLPKDGNGDASIPAGQSVHLLGSYQNAGGHCSAAVRFVPAAGEVYDVVNDVRAEHCIINVMRHDASAQYGLRVEPSTRAPTICQP